MCVKNISLANLPSVERLREAFFYDGKNLRWKIKVKGGRGLGELVGSLLSQGYRNVTLDRKQFRAHRAVWAYVHGEWPTMIVDHINGDIADDRIENLRLCNDSQSAANTRVCKNNLLGVKGVYRTPAGRFAAQKGGKGGRRYLGSFDTIEQASEAFLAAAKDQHGEFAKR